MRTPKMRHCFNCGEEMGAYADYEPLDTCGKQECEKAAQQCVREYSETRKSIRREEDY